MEEAKKDRKKARKDRKDRKRQQQKKVRRPRPQKQQPDLLTYLLMSKMTGGGGSGGGGISVGPQPLTSQLGQLQAEIAKKTSDLESRLANLASDNALLLEGIKQAETRFGTQQGLAQEQTKQLIQEVKEDIKKNTKQMGIYEKIDRALEDDELNIKLASKFPDYDIKEDELLRYLTLANKGVFLDDLSFTKVKADLKKFTMPPPKELIPKKIEEEIQYGDPSNQEEGGSMGTSSEEVFGGV